MKTLLISMVCSVLVIALAVTVVFAFNNSTSESDVIHYFSLHDYFENLTLEEVVFPAGRYYIDYNYSSGALGVKNVYATVIINNRELRSVDFCTVEQVRDRDFQFQFKIDGVFYSTSSYDSDPEKRWLRLPEIVVSLKSLPDFQIVMDAWNDKEGDLFNAFGVTFSYVGDWITYFFHSFSRLSPFNSFVEGDRNYLDSLLPPLES